MKKKMVVLILTAVLVGTMFTGCGSSATTSETASSEAEEAVSETSSASSEGEENKQEISSGGTIGIIQPAFAPYCEAIVDGATGTLESAGYTVNTKYGDLTSEGQVTDIEDFVTVGVSALIVFPWVSDATRGALEECEAAGIPVFVVDNPVEYEELVVTQVATDNYQAGVANAEQMIADLGGQGRIIILDTPENNSSLLRANGFVDTLAEKAPDIEIIAQQNYNADQSTAMSIMEDLIQADSDFDAVFACNEDGSFGVVAALEAAALNDVKVYTVDGSANGVAMVKEGKITGIAAQQPFLMGETAAEKVIAYFNGEEIEKDIPLDIMYVTSENADSWEGY